MGELVDLEIVRVSGPHPGFGNDEWCNAAIAALDF